ncbi:MAG: tol-pal system protein YbgF, partial [Steroidobacteraceae bacterium]|nr:tol-pal system protein YbgF [Steroidobacteraceae bacterium]
RIAGDAARAGASNGAAAPPAVPAGDPQQLDYSRAFDALKAARYNDAIAGFKEFLARYPTGALADNAQYWLAETYYVTRQYDLALAAFAALERNWPDSAKRADAQLKRGFTLYELNRLGEARAVLSEVAQRYPGSEVARLAEERLRRIPAHAR